MAKVHKTIRIEENLYSSMQKLKVDGESDTELLTRVLKTGTEVLEGEYKQAQEQTEDNAHLIKLLKHSNELLEKQLVIKDEQIRALTSLCDTAQKVSGLTTATTNKALDTTATSTATSKPSFKERMRNFFS